MKRFNDPWRPLFLAANGPGEGGWRSYRSEVDIILNILRVVASAEPYGVKKTRLMQLSNLNSQTAAKYLRFLESVGLIEENENTYRMKPRGMLVMLLIDLYRSLVSPLLAAGDGYDSLRAALESAARGLGASVEYDAAFYDAKVNVGGARIGVVFVAGCDEQCRRALHGLLGEVARSIVDLNMIVVLDSSEAPASGFEKKEGSLIVWIPNKGDREELLARALREAAEMAGRSGRGM